MSKAKTEYRIGTGSSSVLMILVVMAMAALSLLAFGSARNTKALTERNVQMSVAYYEAAARIQEKLALIDETLFEYAEKNAGNLPDLVWLTEQKVANAEWTAQDEMLFFTLTEDTGEEHAVVASGKLGKAGEKRYELLEHKLVDTRPYSNQEMMNLMGE
ncbi:MAG: hypothetical protein RSC40_08170 [Clostridia bacterium]